MFHSQYKQDALVEEKIFKGFKNGFFVDVGAYDGKHINNTLYFEENNNWKGINCEPLPDIYERLIKNRPSCINLQLAVSETEGEQIFVKNEGYSEMLSGLKTNYDKRHYERLTEDQKRFGGSTNEIKVKTRRLETIFEEYGVKRVHYLSIDVEGSEFSVIKSIDFNKVFIDVIQFENNYEDLTEPIIEYLNDKGYELLFKYADIFMIHRKSEFYSQMS